MESAKIYRTPEFQFSYPADWELSPDARDGAEMVTVGDGSAFWAISTLHDEPDVADVLQQALDAFEDEYEETDQYPWSGEIAGQPAQGFDLEFMAMDLVNWVQLRSFQRGPVTLLIIAQGTDMERSEYEPRFGAITKSLEVFAPEE